MPLNVVMEANRMAELAAMTPHYYRSTVQPLSLLDSAVQLSACNLAAIGMGLESVSFNWFYI